MKKIALILCLFAPSLATAYEYEACGDDPTEWGSEEVTFKASDISFPSGSPQRTALLKMINQWNAIVEGDVEFKLGTDTDDSMGHYQDGSEIGFVDPEDLDESLGRASSRYNYFCGGGISKHIVECDIRFSATPKRGIWFFGEPSPREVWPTSDNNTAFRPIALHELGHCLGLRHERDGMSLMDTQYPSSGWYDTKGVLPHGDDVLGALEAYPDSEPGGIDLAPINFYNNSWTGRAKLVEGIIAPDQPLGINETFTIDYNFGNAYSVGAEFKLCFYLSKDATYDTEDNFRIMDCDTWWSGTGLESYGIVPLQKSLRVPGFASEETEQRYYVLVCADPFPYEDVDEIREDNNCVALPGTLRVQPGGVFGETAE